MPRWREACQSSHGKSWPCREKRSAENLLSADRVRDANKTALGPTTAQVNWLIAEVGQLQHDLANAQAASGYARELKEELDRSGAEVERLTAENGKLKEVAADEPKTRAYWSSAYYRMEAERDRYKAALEEIVTPRPSWECPVYYAEAENLQRIARGSLAEAVRLQGPKPAPKNPIHDESAIGA